MANERIDIVTLAAPRPTITQAIESLLSRIDAAGYRLRWIVHLDWIDCLAEQYHDCHARIEQLVARFDEAVVLTADKNRGHPGSFHACMQAVENDFIYWEDDKLCIATLPLRRLVESPGDPGPTRTLGKLGSRGNLELIIRIAFLCSCFRRAMP